jgi:hypothetical protein
VPRIRALQLLDNSLEPLIRRKPDATGCRVVQDHLKPTNMKRQILVVKGGQSPAGGGPSPAREHHRYSRLDHVYTKGLVSESVVLPDSTTDYRPVKTTVRAGSHAQGVVKLVSLKRQKFKAVTRQELEGALNLTEWTEV